MLGQSRAAWSKSMEKARLKVTKVLIMIRVRSMSRLVEYVERALNNSFDLKVRLIMKTRARGPSRWCTGSRGQNLKMSVLGQPVGTVVRAAGQSPGGRCQHRRPV